MDHSIEALFRFQMEYLKKIVNNIPEEQLYALQLEGFNSAGWILGHLFVEVQDVFDFLAIKYQSNDTWNALFRNTTGRIQNLENLPSKETLLNAIYDRYEQLLLIYRQLEESERSGPHPSRLIKNLLPNLDAWIAHHLTTHIAVHCGNLVVWKKMIGLAVDGF